ncbi:MAG: Snf7 family protein [Desulfurococcales archaeon]|jgi:division protein CdvB (Snf7/Vps24/ESCRT-III family)|nr:Snf7 family protein [Desulfurococcales archaeon]
MGLLSGGVLGSGSRGIDKKKKERAEAVLIMLRNLLSRIDMYISRLEEREKQLFNNVVELTSMGDDMRAKIVAGEVSQIRSVLRHMTAVRYIVEGILLKIENYLALGQAIESLGPAVAVLREIRGIFKGLMPSMELEVQMIESGLKEIISEHGEYIPSSALYTPQASQEAREILEEAYILAEKRLRNTFPLASKDEEKSKAK